jgi:hypothetical protein
VLYGKTFCPPSVSSIAFFSSSINDAFNGNSSGGVVTVLVLTSVGVTWLRSSIDRSIAYKYLVQYYSHNYKFQAIIFEEEKPRGNIKQKVLSGN